MIHSRFDTQNLIDLQGWSGRTDMQAEIMPLKSAVLEQLQKIERAAEVSPDNDHEDDKES